MLHHARDTLRLLQVLSASVLSHLHSHLLSAACKVLFVAAKRLRAVLCCHALHVQALLPQTFTYMCSQALHVRAQRLHFKDTKLLPVAICVCTYRVLPGSGNAVYVQT